MEGMSVTAIAHVCLRTRDLAATERFYTELLGFTRQFYFTRKGKIIGFYLRLADRVFVEAFEAGEVPETTQAHALGHFCLECSDIRALHARFLQAGHAVGEVKIGADGTWQFWTRDPNGVPLEFHQYTPESAQFRSEDVEVNW